MDESGSPAPVPVWKRIAPLVVLAAVLALVISQGWHKFLTLEFIAAERDMLMAFVEGRYGAALAVYMLVYVVAVALSLPGGALLTITGGFLFGWAVAGAVTVVAATTGAVAVFLIAKTALGEMMAARAGAWLDKLRAGFQEDALHYLLFLRLVPVVPFWLANLAPALLGVPLRQYTLATFTGIIPGTFAFAVIGSGLDSIITKQQQIFADCLVREKSGALAAGETCQFKLDPGALITPEMLAAFAALGFIALMPVAIKKWRRRADGKDMT